LRPVASIATRNNVPETSGWRRTVPTNHAPPVSTRTPPLASSRAESPAPAFGAPKFKVGASQWRQREEAKAAGGSHVRPASPAIAAPKNDPKRDEEGFTTVPEKKPWRPKREGRVLNN
jgi:translation initiation factor 3 subunit A